MSDEMKDLYRQLDTNLKRNELNSLIIKIDQLLQQLLMSKNLDVSIFPEIKNYDSKKQSNEQEDEILLQTYDDLWTIKAKILFLLSMDNYGQL